MYYKKRPELLSMVEDFYRTHRLLAERYDQVKPETGNRVPKTVESSFPSFKNHQSEKFIGFEDHSYDSYSENCDVEESVESEIEDLEQEEDKENAKFVNNNEQEKVRFAAGNDGVTKMKKEFELFSEKNKAHKDQIKQKDNIGDEIVKLREEIERLEKENRAQKNELKQKGTICDELMMLREEIERVRKENKALKDDLKQKDKEKIDVIKQLSVTIDVLKQEYVKMRGFIAKESTKKWKTPFDFNRIIAFSEKLFNGTPRNQQPSVVPL